MIMGGFRRTLRRRKSPTGWGRHTCLPVKCHRADRPDRTRSGGSGRGYSRISASGALPFGILASATMPARAIAIAMP